VQIAKQKNAVFYLAHTACGGAPGFTPGGWYAVLYKFLRVTAHQSGKIRFERGVCAAQMLGNDAHFIHDGHKRRVAVPAGDKMKVQMFANARPGRFSEIQADVDSLRRKALLQYGGALLQQSHHLLGFVRRQITEIHAVAKGSDHNMPVIIRKFIHDHEILFSPVQNQSFLVFILMPGQAKDAGIRLWTKNILDAPRAPKLFHISFRKICIARAACSGAPVFCPAIPRSATGNAFQQYTEDGFWASPGKGDSGKNSSLVVTFPNRIRRFFP
jgi:hypothetical protein